MDKGEILKQGFEVRPADNGGFVILGGDYDDAEIIAALSTADALVEWLRSEAIALRTLVSKPASVHTEEEYLKQKIKAQRTAPAGEWKPT